MVLLYSNFFISQLPFIGLIGASHYFRHCCHDTPRSRQTSTIITFARSAVISPRCSKSLMCSKSFCCSFIFFSSLFVRCFDGCHCTTSQRQVNYRSSAAMLTLHSTHYCISPLLRPFDPAGVQPSVATGRGHLAARKSRPPQLFFPTSKSQLYAHCPRMILDDNSFFHFC